MNNPIKNNNNNKEVYEFTNKTSDEKCDQFSTTITYERIHTYTTENNDKETVNVIHIIQKVFIKIVIKFYFNVVIVRLFSPAAYLLLN